MTKQKRGKEEEGMGVRKRRGAVWKNSSFQKEQRTA